MIVLDASRPVDAPTIIAAARSVGAEGLAGYLRGWPQWTAEVARAILDAGLGFLPIDLYQGQAPRETVDIVMSWMLPPGPIALDVETGSMPSDDWQRRWVGWVQAHGYGSVDYGHGSTAVAYDKRWTADYGPGTGRTTVEPVIDIPAGFDALQYAHDIPLPGVSVDASNVGFQLMRFGGAGDGWWFLQQAGHRGTDEPA
jgi:hypothetical protein